MDLIEKLNEVEFIAFIKPENLILSQRYQIFNMNYITTIYGEKLQVKLSDGWLILPNRLKKNINQSDINNFLQEFDKFDTFIKCTGFMEYKGKQCPEYKLEKEKKKNYYFRQVMEFAADVMKLAPTKELIKICASAVISKVMNWFTIQPNVQYLENETII